MAHIIWIGQIVGNYSWTWPVLLLLTTFITGDLLSELEESAVPGRREIVFSRPAIQTLWDTRKSTTESILKIKQRDCVKYKYAPPHPSLSLPQASNCNYCTYVNQWPSKPPPPYTPYFLISFTHKRQTKPIKHKGSSRYTMYSSCYPLKMWTSTSSRLGPSPPYTHLLPSPTVSQSICSINMRYYIPGSCTGMMCDWGLTCSRTVPLG